MSFPRKAIKDKKYPTEKLKELALRIIDENLLYEVASHPNSNEEIFKLVFAKVEKDEVVAKLIQLSFDKYDINFDDDKILFATRYLVNDYYNFGDGNNIDFRFFTKALPALKKENINTWSLDDTLNYINKSNIKNIDLADIIDTVVDESVFIYNDLVIDALINKIEETSDFYEFISFYKDKDVLIKLFNHLKIKFNTVDFCSIIFNILDGDIPECNCIYEEVLDMFERKLKSKVLD